MVAQASQAVTLGIALARPLPEGKGIPQAWVCLFGGAHILYSGSGREGGRHGGDGQDWKRHFGLFSHSPFAEAGRRQKMTGDRQAGTAHHPHWSPLSLSPSLSLTADFTHSYSQAGVVGGGGQAVMEIPDRQALLSSINACLLRPLGPSCTRRAGTRPQAYSLHTCIQSSGRQATGELKLGDSLLGRQTWTFLTGELTF